MSSLSFPFPSCIAAVELNLLVNKLHTRIFYKAQTMRKLAGSLTKTYRKHFDYPVVSVLRLQGTITAQRGDDLTD